MADFDMNSLLRGAQVDEQAPSGEGGVAGGSMSIDSYRELSVFTRAHEWDSLTDDDRQVALREGIQPEHVRSVGGRSDAGSGSQRDETAATDMNEFLRGAAFESRGEGA